MVQDIDVRFHPEVIIVGPDPTSGLLIKQFTIFHEVVTTSFSTIEGPLGEVMLQALGTSAIVRIFTLKMNFADKCTISTYMVTH